MNDALMGPTACAAVRHSEANWAVAQEELLGAIETCNFGVSVNLLKQRLQLKKGGMLRKVHLQAETRLEPSGWAQRE